MASSETFSLPGALGLLLEAARALAARSTSARIAVARLDGIVSPEMLPALVREEIAGAVGRALASTARPLEIAEVERALARAWATSPGRVLDALDPEPLSVGPHAQVHRGAIGGAAVAIKVMRPELASRIRSELSLLTALVAPLSAAFPASDPAASLRVVREHVLDELDLESEGELQRRVGRALRGVDGASVARVHGEHTTETVLVADLIEGATLAERRPEDPGAVARALVRVYLGAPHALGGVLANPRASDVVAGPDGGVVLLVTGAFATVSRERVDASLDALEALRDDDREVFVRAAADRMALLDEPAARGAHELLRALFGDLLGGPLRFDAAWLAGLGGRMLASIDDLYALAAAATPSPTDLWPTRMLAQLAGLLARVEATEDWVELALAAARAGWE